jgi:hypothetical protein
LIQDKKAGGIRMEGPDDFSPTDPPQAPEMDLATATSNYALLRALPEGTKIYVDAATGQMTLDDRYFGGARRWIGGTSRNDLIEPLRQTFQVMSETAATPAELLSTFNYTRERLIALYPEFDDLFEKLREDLWDVTQTTRTSSPPPAPPTPPAPPSVRRRGSQVIINIPVDDFQQHQQSQSDDPLDDDETFSGCFGSGENGWCKRIVDFFRGIGKKRSD